VLGAAHVDLMTLFPAHTYLAEKNAGFRAKSCLEYEDFNIPFDEKYNLIIENHILIHMMDVNKTFEVFRSHLEPNGSIFLQKELDDTQLFRSSKNLFAELRPFHYHQFDVPTAERLLRRYGFDIVFLTNRLDADDGGDDGPELFGVARLSREPAACPRIGAAELRARLDMYARWRDESILSLPKERCHALFGDELSQVWRRVKARGGLKRKPNGKLRALRRFREADVDAESLEIGSKIVQQGTGLRARTQNWVADRMRGTRVAGWLAQRLAGTRGGEWIERRVIGSPDGKTPMRGIPRA
jgi:hypothetical protein